MSLQDDLKREAAQLAASFVTDGMVVGLGTGSTAEFFLQEMGRRVGEGLNIVGIPTSAASERRAKELGIPLTTLDDQDHIDLTVDGADEVDLTTFYLVKGRGGALLREKIVASATKMQVIIADESKLVKSIGDHGVVPVEVIPFGLRQTKATLKALGARTMLRGKQGAPKDWPAEDPADTDDPFITDSGNVILDCHWETIADAAVLAAQIKGTTGVVEHGIFINLAHRVVVAGSSGVTAYEKGS